MANKEIDLIICFLRVVDIFVILAAGTSFVVALRYFSLDRSRPSAQFLCFIRSTLFKRIFTDTVIAGK
jgi:hypothetical protein